MLFGEQDICFTLVHCRVIFFTSKSISKLFDILTVPWVLDGAAPTA